MKDRAYETAINPKYDGYQRRLVIMVYKILDKTKESGASINEEIAQILHKLVIEKFKRTKVYARFKDNSWAADLAEMGSMSSKNQDVKYLLCVIDVFTKYTWIKPLKD